jgi:hypothetical protein
VTRVRADGYDALMPHQLTIWGVTLAAACGTGGCASTANDRLTLGDSVYLPGLAGPPESGSDWGHEPSLTGLERANWGRTTIAVPVNGIAHAPTYARNVRRAFVTPRQLGRSPNADSCLDLVGGSARPQRWEAVLAPITSIGQVVLFIPRMILHRPWATDYSPSAPFQRGWTQPSPTAPVEHAE